MNHRRRLLAIALISIIIIGLITLLARFYLHSQFAAVQVANRLQAAYGGRVTVGSVAIGLGQSELRDVRFFETGDETAPWISVAQWTLDVPLQELITGRALPKDMTLRDADVTLRFDRQGHLLTRIPAEAGAVQDVQPGTVHIRQSRIVLRQEGRPDLRIDDIDADLQLSEAARSAGSNSLKLDVANAGAKISAIDLSLEQVAGQVVIDGNLIKLRQLHGHTAGGELETSGEFDFRSEPSKLHFLVDANNLRVRDLPAIWQLPAQIDGLLGGHAELWITLADGRLHTEGQGEAAIRNATFAGVPAESITLRLVPAGEGFRFTTPNALKPNNDMPGVNLAWWVTGLMVAMQQSSEGYVEVNLALKDVDLAQLIAGLKVDLPVELKGRGSIAIKLAIPVNSVGNLQTYRVAGTAHLHWAELVGLRFEDVAARLNYQNGFLQLDDLKGQIPGEVPREGGPPMAAMFTSSSRVQVVPAGGDLTGDLQLKRMSLTQALHVVTNSAEQAGGVISGAITFSAPLARLREFASWHGSGELWSDRLQFAGQSAADLRALVRLSSGVLQLSELSAQLNDATVLIAGHLDLRVTNRFAGVFTLKEGVTAVLHQLARQFEAPLSFGGNLQITANLQGSLRPFAITTTGTAQADSLEVDNVRLANVSARWSQEPDRIRLSSIRAALYGGNLTGLAAAPLQPKTPGDAFLAFEGVDVGLLSKATRAIPFPLEGKASGTATGTLSAMTADGRRDITFALDMQAPRLRVQNVPTDRLHGTVTYRNGSIGYDLQGHTLGGVFQLNGVVPPAEAPPAAQPPQGRLRILGARMSRLWRALQLNESFGRVTGILDVDIAFRHVGPDRLPFGDGVIVLRDFSWDGENRERLQAGVILRGEEIFLRNFRGEFNQGLLSGQLTYNWKRPSRGWFNVRLERANVARLVALWPMVAAHTSGTADVQVRGHFGDQWEGDGSVAVGRGSIHDLEVVDWSIPFTFRFTPAEGRGQIAVAQTHAQLARGRFTGRADLGFGLGSRLEGQFRFNQLDLRSFARAVADASYLGTGLVSGRLDLAGRDIRSIDDVTATLEASLRQTQALQFPVLQQVGRYVLPGQTPTTAFDSGDVRARLERGMIRLERLRLVSPTVQLIVEGRITLTGRLDLEVTAHTGPPGVNLPALRLLGVSVPATGAVPVALAVRATTLLANRTIHLHVGGTLRSPSIQVEPLAILTDEATRFFLNWATGGFTGAVIGPSVFEGLP
jgi:hypothetical protein